MKKTLLFLGVCAFVLSTTSCLVKSRVCSCSYTDQSGTFQTFSEEYIGGMMGTSKKSQKAECDNLEASLKSQYGASANCDLN